MEVRNTVFIMLGIVGSVIAHYLGGWDTALQTLLLFMGMDYIAGLIVAGVFHNSKKTETGTLESRAGWKGLCRKGATLFIVLIAAQLDRMAGTDVIRNGVIIAYIANEGISIIENIGLMGVPIPKTLTNAIELLRKKESDNNENSD